MGFNELNSVENKIIHQLCGVNLNAHGARDPQTAYSSHWVYQSAEEIKRGVNEVLVESDLKAALVRLNPEITRNESLADEVIYKLRAVFLSVNQVGLVKTNEEFFKWLTGEKTMPFGENNRHVPVRLIDFEDHTNNTYVATNQYRVHHRETKIPDIVLLINGIPVVVGEAKTPIRPSVSWLDGAHEIHDVYENSIPQLFVPNILSFATEGKELYYGSIRSPLQYWAPWRLENDDDALAKRLGLSEIGKELSDLLHPARLLDIMRNFSLFSTDKKKRRIKIIPRFQQYEGANKIVERVKEGRVKKGLIWHFQGSGKSFLMVFAAQKLRRMAELKSPTVIILVDRTDLDTQISGTFNAADIANVETTDNIRDLQNLLERFKKHEGNPNFKKLSERLEELRDKAERGLITSIEFVKELCKLAKETVQAEKELEEAIAEKTPQAALTELFMELKTDQTPAVVERIVTDIDAIVRVVRFPGWQQSNSGEREVQSSLRKVLWAKYKIKDQVLFDRAYAYIKEYY